jgi:hypothetical protein
MCLVTVAVTRPASGHDTACPMPAGLGVWGDASMVLLVSLELRSFVRMVRTPLTLSGRCTVAKGRVGLPWAPAAGADCEFKRKEFQGLKAVWAKL